MSVKKIKIYKKLLRRAMLERRLMNSKKQNWSKKKAIRGRKKLNKILQKTQLHMKLRKLFSE